MPRYRQTYVCISTAHAYFSIIKHEGEGEKQPNHEGPSWGGTSPAAAIGHHFDMKYRSIFATLSRVDQYTFTWYRFQGPFPFYLSGEHAFFVYVQPHVKKHFKSEEGILTSVVNF